MGVTIHADWLRRATGRKAFGKASGGFVVALAGNPNTGKSTLFNALTGLNQHTGNWPGKTVATAYGHYTYRNKMFMLVDLPGTYSLFTSSPEEDITRDFILFAQPHVTVVVTDATCLERNLNLTLQVLEITPKTVVCVNLMDQAGSMGIDIDTRALARELGVPVVGTAARVGLGLKELKEAIYQVASGLITPAPVRVRYTPQLQAAADELAARISQMGLGNDCATWLAMRLLEPDGNARESAVRYLEGWCGRGLVGGNRA